jgi:hypothetical protein
MGAGQYLTGTFTADAATQGIVFNGVTPLFAAYQVREVPEPSTLILAGTGIIGLLLCIRRKRK